MMKADFGQDGGESNAKKEYTKNLYCTMYALAAKYPWMDQKQLVNMLHALVRKSTMKNRGPVAYFDDEMDGVRYGCAFSLQYFTEKATLINNWNHLFIIITIHSRCFWFIDWSLFQVNRRCYIF